MQAIIEELRVKTYTKQTSQDSSLRKRAFNIFWKEGFLEKHGNQLYSLTEAGYELLIRQGLDCWLRREENVSWQQRFWRKLTRGW
ncbi:hypothetical protein BWI93_20390 [Siphonobacter sp. BAB-5385]|nr:hypothetical protein BWI93_20390 [Siphonobacter sp. BAB-5385]PMD90710.1 hypothetical protein BWI97_22270 [Siphonobacter sp. BAB-5405]